MANEERNLSHAAPETVEELEAIKDWWGTHGNTVSVIIIAVLAAIIGFQQYGRWSDRQHARAMGELDQARTPEALETIISDDVSHAVTPLARLRLAGLFFQQKKYALAKSVYTSFLNDSPDHALADIATVGLAHALEADGDVAEAAEQFKTFAAENPGSFLAPMATIGHGRALILAGRRDEGRAVLDLFITETAGTRWAAYTDEVLRSRDRLTVSKPAETTDLSAFFSADADVAETTEEAVEAATSVDAGEADAAGTPTDPKDAAPTE